MLPALLDRCLRDDLDIMAASRDGGNTAIHMAARRESPAAVAMLLRQGADPLTSNTAGYGRGVGESWTCV